MILSLYRCSFEILKFDVGAIRSDKSNKNAQGFPPCTSSTMVIWRALTVALLYNTYLKKIIEETASKDVLNFDFSCMEEPVKKKINNNYLFNNYY